LDALFLGFGGLLSLGVNLSLMALPAVAIHYLFSSQLKNSSAFLKGALAGGGAIAATGILAALALGNSSDAFIPAAKIVLVSHLPLVAMEAVLTGSAVALMARIKPELFGLTPSLDKISA
jgi:cobalt/nickel transport system permease protein